MSNGVVILFDQFKFACFVNSFDMQIYNSMLYTTIKIPCL